MVAADDDADGTVRAVVGVAQWVVFVPVRLEAKFVKSMLQTFMEWRGIGTKRNNPSLAAYLKVEMLA